MRVCSQGRKRLEVFRGRHLAGLLSVFGGKAEILTAQTIIFNRFFRLSRKRVLLKCQHLPMPALRITYNWKLLPLKERSSIIIAVV